MPRLLKIGNVHRSTTLLDRLTFPVLDELLAMDTVAEAVRYAATHRSGVIAVGDKGLGKSIALECAADDFAHSEAARNANDATLAVRELVLVPPIQAESRTELIRALYREEMGDLPARVSRNGDSALLEDLIEAWLDRNIVAVCFDEAEGLGNAALEVCRDIMSVSSHKAGRTRGPQKRRIRTGGIGVVLVGTPDLVKRLRRSKDYGERWGRTLAIERLPNDLVPLIYREYLPAFRQEAERRGENAWSELVIRELVPHLHGSVRRIEEHIRTYVTRYIDNAEVPPTEVEEIQFDEGLFLYTLHEMVLTESLEFDAA